MGPSLTTEELAGWVKSRGISDADAAQLAAVFEERDAAIKRAEEAEALPRVGVLLALTAERDALAVRLKEAEAKIQALMQPTECEECQKGEPAEVFVSARCFSARLSSLRAEAVEECAKVCDEEGQRFDEAEQRYFRQRETSTAAEAYQRACQSRHIGSRLRALSSDTKEGTAKNE